MKKNQIKKLLLVDLDDTLVNTRLFKQGLFSDISKTLLLDIPLIEKIYEETLPARHNMWSVFMEKISTLDHVQRPKLEQIVDQNISKTRINKEILERVKRFEGQKILFSLGEKEFQLRKLKLLNLEHLFDEIFVTHEPKIEFFRKNVNQNALNAFNGNYQDVTVVDDHKDFINDLSTEFPWVKVIDAKSLIS